MLCTHDASCNERELSMTCSTFGSFSYNFHLICYRPNRGECNQHRHLKWQRDGNQQHGVVLVLRRYTVLASVVCWAAHHPPAPLTSPITWIRAVNRLLGGSQPRLAAAGSATQLNDAGQRHTENESARDDVTEHELDH